MKVIEQRKEIYGDFKDVAKVSQELKLTMIKGYTKNEPVVNEGLDMIIHKLARIGAKEDGWKNTDSWIDLSNYAKLVADYLESQPGMLKTTVAYEKTN